MIQTLLNGNIENPEYIQKMLQEFHLNAKKPKRVLLLQVCSHEGRSGISTVESAIHHLFERIPDSVFCFQYPNEFAAIIDSTSFDTHQTILESFVSARDDVLLGVGRTDSIYQLDDSLRTARIALESLSGSETHFALFDKLTLEIILARIDSVTKKDFLSKAAAGLSSEDFSLLRTYFEEEQSLNRTCEKLFLHKNTLQYKLDRIYRICGLNPRRFQDAVILYLAVKLLGNNLF